jgi:hypothetical protein
MLTIPIQVSGDRWNNHNNVKEMLDQTNPGDFVMLDLCSEGPSLHKLGVIELLQQYNLNISITRWSNSIETVPYRRVACNVNSHFFPMSHHYWIDEIDNLTDAQFRFAMFLGRGCPSRNRILYDVYHRYGNNFLLSKLPCRNGNSWGTEYSENCRLLETVDQWFDDPAQARQWFDQCPVISIDNHVVQDQFVIPEVSAGQMARSLMQHYPRFNVELVCETYTLGETFFPTEKTIRPMVGNKPFLMYGPANYLNNLKQRGFRTFDSVWNESYDQYEGPQRWVNMRELIDQLAQISSTQWAQILQHCAQITQHNRSIVRQMIYDLKGI